MEVCQNLPLQNGYDTFVSYLCFLFSNFTKKWWETFQKLKNNEKLPLKVICNYISILFTVQNRKIEKSQKIKHVILIKNNCFLKSNTSLIFFRLTVLLESRLSKYFYLKTILLSYMFGLFWALPPLFGWGAYSIEPFGTACSIGKVPFY